MRVVLDVRKYHYPGDDKSFTVKYKIFFNNGVISDIKNEYGYSIEKNSDCWDYFVKKYD